MSEAGEAVVVQGDIPIDIFRGHAKAFMAFRGKPVLPKWANKDYFRKMDGFKKFGFYKAASLFDRRKVSHDRAFWVYVLYHATMMEPMKAFSPVHSTSLIDCYEMNLKALASREMGMVDLERAQRIKEMKPQDIVFQMRKMKLPVLDVLWFWDWNNAPGRWVRRTLVPNLEVVKTVANQMETMI